MTSRPDFRDIFLWKSVDDVTYLQLDEVISRKLFVGPFSCFHCISMLLISTTAWLRPVAIKRRGFTILWRFGLPWTFTGAGSLNIRLFLNSFEIATVLWSSSSTFFKLLQPGCSHLFYMFRLQQAPLYLCCVLLSIHHNLLNPYQPGKYLMNYHS